MVQKCFRTFIIVGQIVNSNNDFYTWCIVCNNDSSTIPFIIFLTNYNVKLLFAIRYR